MSPYYCSIPSEPRTIRLRHRGTSRQRRLTRRRWQRIAGFSWRLGMPLVIVQRRAGEP